MNFHGSLRFLINQAWLASCSRRSANFHSSLDQVEKTQQRYLLELLRRNSDTEFGKKYGFRSIRSIRQYQEQVPINRYEDLSLSIESIAHGKSSVLTHDAVKQFHPTSGSRSATKLIPWTKSLAGEFQDGIAPWITSLYRRRPAIMTGTAYWSASPPATKEQTHGKLRVGFEHDSEYLGFLGSKLFAQVSAMPQDVSLCRDISLFKKKTLVSLLSDEELSLISIWSPTFLTVLLDDFVKHPEEILSALDKNRARIIGQFLEQKGISAFEHIWPNLQVISCWTHGASELYAKNLRSYFPTVEIQGKGLVATEAFVSLPFREGIDPVLAVTSHFFEFENLATGHIHLAHELKTETTYNVVVTTGGGLYRYRLGDIVKASDFCKHAPCLRFVGREGVISDLFGEKLNEAFVGGAIREILAQESVKPRFILLAPVSDPLGGIAYALFLDSERISDSLTLRYTLDAKLAENFHYAHCLRLGQLKRLRIFEIDVNEKSAESVYSEEKRSRGQKLGDIKISILDSQMGWERVFKGSFMA